MTTRYVCIAEARAIIGDTYLWVCATCLQWHVLDDATPERSRLGYPVRCLLCETTRDRRNARG